MKAQTGHSHETTNTHTKNGEGGLLFSVFDCDEDGGFFRRFARPMSADKTCVWLK